VIRRVASTAVAAAAAAGLVTAVVPQHAASLAVLAAATVAAVTAVLLLAVTGPLVAARPPAWPVGAERRGAPPLDPQGLRDARRAVAAHVRAGADLRDLLDPTRSTARPTPTGGTR